MDFARRKHLHGHGSKPATQRSRSYVKALLLQVIVRDDINLDELHRTTTPALDQQKDRVSLVDDESVSVKLTSSKILGQDMYLVDINVTQARIESQINYDTDDFEHERDPGITIQINSRPQSPL